MILLGSLNLDFCVLETLLLACYEVDTLVIVTLSSVKILSNSNTSPLPYHFLTTISILYT
jgi:hypothetical protein